MEGRWAVIIWRASEVAGDIKSVEVKTEVGWYGGLLALVVHITMSSWALGTKFGNSSNTSLFSYMLYKFVKIQSS